MQRPGLEGKARSAERGAFRETMRHEDLNRKARIWRPKNESIITDQRFVFDHLSKVDFKKNATKKYNRFSVAESKPTGIS